MPDAFRHGEVGWRDGPQVEEMSLDAEIFWAGRLNEWGIERGSLRGNERCVASLVEGQESRDHGNLPISQSRCFE
jgi:hypothetical protein